MLKFAFWADFHKNGTEDLPFLAREPHLIHIMNDDTYFLKMFQIINYCNNEYENHCSRNIQCQDMSHRIPF